MQESGLIEIIPLICTSALWGQYPVSLHPEFPSGCSCWGQLQWLVAWGRAACLLKWQAAFFVHKPRRVTRPHGGTGENYSGRRVLAEGKGTGGPGRAEGCLEAAVFQQRFETQSIDFGST